VSHLLDTNICIAFLNGRDPKVRNRLLALDPGEVVVCSVVKAELAYGARFSERVEGNLERLARFCHPFLSLSFDDAAAEQYGLVRAQLRQAGTLIGLNDLLIASISLAHDLTLVTRNQKEFQRVAGLKIIGW
jgi:tRNA(fMet)-specific endonuclease VapC